MSYFLTPHLRCMFKGIRIFPDDHIYQSTGLVEPSEIVSCGERCRYEISPRYDGIVFSQNIDGTFMSGAKKRRMRDKYYVVYPITEKRAVALAQKAMRKLPKDKQLIYYEQCHNGNIPDYAPFEFCGFELEHTYEGGSPHLDIGYPFNNDKDVTEKLNRFGLFKTFEDILYYKAKVDEDDMFDYNNGEPTDDCVIHGVWRYIK